MHLSASVALDFLDGLLVKDEELFWLQHLEFCKDCMHDVARWRQLWTGLKRSHLQNASDQALKNAIDVYPVTRPDHDASPRRFVVGTILFDSFVQPALAGARGSSASGRQLVMRAEEFDVHVKIWGEPDHRKMLGQLLPRSGNHFMQSARFHLLRNGERVESTSVDDMGEFHFTEVPEGDLSLQIDLPNLTVIGALNIKKLNDSRM